MNDEKIIQLLSSGNVNDLVYAVRSALALGITPKDMSKLIKRAKPHAWSAQDYVNPLIIMDDGWFIASGGSEWLCSRHAHYFYTEGCIYDLRGEGGKNETT